ncbi:hypothetical protein MPL1032_270014 [Mesorhizobium plurifarium]|uniref:Uncharacterized protein n=1 Tax=Mesorhizobium plurifarium TaxID=69974 RepID=A0A0K2W2G4_MESPL|nr:hypothetical protein MPL1032_270014 [Mesorhizobium plurifarium]
MFWGQFQEKPDTVLWQELRQAKLWEGPAERGVERLSAQGSDGGFCRKGGRSAFGSGTRRPLCASAGRPTPRTQEMRRT